MEARSGPAWRPATTGAIHYVEAMPHGPVDVCRPALACETTYRRLWTFMRERVTCADCLAVLAERATRDRKDRAAAAAAAL